MPSTEDHPTFPLTISREQKIWRYMDFTKFAHMLLSRAVWFSRVDRLCDNWEGKYTKIDIRKYGGPEACWNIYSTENDRQWTYVNCWYISDYESAAMWKLYSQSRESVAIQSTYYRLHCEMPEECYIGEITYKDYNKDQVAICNGFAPFMHKRLSFAHERELRAIIYDWETAAISTDREDTFEHDYSLINQKNGIEIKVNIKNLIENIYVSPMSPEWFKKLVENFSLMFGFNVSQIIASEIDEIPY